VTSRAVTATVGDWLRAESFLDGEVTLDDVRFHSGGPVAFYLRMMGRRAMTLGDHVFFRDEGLIDQAKQANWPLYVHELVHVAQYRREGYPKFLGAYTWDVVRAGVKYSSKLPREAPAYARQREAERRLGLR
jgi:hypothetical protein